MTKFLIHGTVPWSASSYSVLTARLVPRMIKAGKQVEVSVWYGLQGKPLPWSVPNGDGSMHNINIWPHHQVGGNEYGLMTLEPLYRFLKADAVITICDVFVFPPQVTHRMHFCPWFPVDIEPANALIPHLEPSIYPMCFSKWGVEKLAEVGFKAHYVPCGAPTGVFKPGDKAKAREGFKTKRPYDFLVSMVAANKDGSDRKGFNEALLGFAKFLETHPDSILYLHTDWGGPVKIAKLVDQLGIAENVMQPDQFAYIYGLLDENYMANLYRASDVLLNPCKSEGFGLPLVEAQMCGTPIIATDFATTDELMFAGWKLQGQRDLYIGPDAWRYRVSVDAVADALAEAYKEKDNRKLQKKATNGAKRYDNDLIFKDYWLPALKAIEDLVSDPVSLPKWENPRVAVEL